MPDTPWLRQETCRKFKDSRVAETDPLATVVLLAALEVLGSLATDIYLPAIPTMAAALHTDPDQIQLTLRV